MTYRYWVIGGDYSDCQFKDIEPGTAIMHGPYDDEVKARMEWQRLTFGIIAGRQRAIRFAWSRIAHEPSD